MGIGLGVCSVLNIGKSYIGPSATSMALFCLLFIKKQTRMPVITAVTTPVNRQMMIATAIATRGK